MTVTFKHPPVPTLENPDVLSLDPFNEFNPANELHYPTKAGVYIYGLRVEVEGQGRKFVPLCVGEAGDLRERLFKDHYCTLKTNGNNHKELFYLENRMTLEEIINVCL